MTLAFRKQSHGGPRIRRRTAWIYRSSLPSRVMTHPDRSCRCGPRPRKIAAGSRLRDSTARAVLLRIGAPGLMRSRCLHEALKLEPDSIAVARRLCRIYIGALARPDLALDYGKRVLAAEPGDSETLSQLVEYYRRNDPAGAETLLNAVLANPKLEAHAFGRLLAEYELGRLYSGRLHQTEKAADAYAKVLAGLDDKSANRLTPVEQFRILGNNPAMAYFNFAIGVPGGQTKRAGGQGARARAGIRRRQFADFAAAGRHVAQAQQGTAGTGPG